MFSGANTLRLYLSAFAHAIQSPKVAVGAGAKLANDVPETFRNRVPEIGAKSGTSVRHDHVAMSNSVRTSTASLRPGVHQRLPDSRESLQWMAGPAEGLARSRPNLAEDGTLPFKAAHRRPAQQKAGNVVRRRPEALAAGSKRRKISTAAASACRYENCL